MGGLQRYSVRSCLQICGCAIILFDMSAMEDARYVPWSHGGLSLNTTEDAQHSARVTTALRLHVEPAVCT